MFFLIYIVNLANECLLLRTNWYMVHSFGQYFLIYDDNLRINTYVPISFLEFIFFVMSKLSRWGVRNSDLVLSLFVDVRPSILPSFPLTAPTQNPNALASGMFYNLAPANSIFVPKW